MGLSDPVAVYNAATNVEAELLRIGLEQAGIEAHITYDESPAGYWMFGRLPEIHKPQVWIDRSQIKLAQVVLEEYERGQREKRANHSRLDDGSLLVECEECGKKSEFPVSKRGTIQDCPHCSAYVDVGEPESSADS